jgi:lipid-binding SYLF domain-containing protein
MPTPSSCSATRRRAQNLTDSSYGYAVFPTIGKGGAVIGAAHGSGRVYVKGEYVGDTSMTQLSVGPQLGGQAYSQIIFFENKRAFEEFTSGNFEFGAQASAVAITAAAEAQATTGVPA